MTHYDWSTSDPCCMTPIETTRFVVDQEILEINHICPKTPNRCDPVLDCLVGCDQFYYSRMPKEFETIDTFTCLIYLVHYLLMLFISTSRYAFFISTASFQEMMIIIPVLVFHYDCSIWGLLLKATSRMIRLKKAEIFLKQDEQEEEDSGNSVDV